MWAKNTSMQPYIMCKDYNIRVGIILFFTTFCCQNILYCLAKFFNICLNNRLKVSEKILSTIQAGFRPGFSTMDHIFTLLCILTLYERLQKNLFIAFIDYQKAFDTVWRAGLWLKLINEGVSGKFLNVVKELYGAVAHFCCFGKTSVKCDG